MSRRVNVGTLPASEPLAVHGDMRLGDLAEILRLLRERNDADRVASLGPSDAEHMGHVGLLETLRSLVAPVPDVERARLPWVHEPDHPHPVKSIGMMSSATVDVPALLFVAANGSLSTRYTWQVRTYGVDRREHGHAYGEAETMAKATEAAERAAAPMIARLVASLDASAATLRAMLVSTASGTQGDP